MEGEAKHKESARRTADLEAKLRKAQGKVDEVVEKFRREEQRAGRAEKELLQTRTAMPGGSELELQLMHNLVQLRNRCVEVENEKKVEEAKVTGIEELLREERERHETTRDMMAVSDKERQELRASIDDLRAHAMQLEAQVSCKAQETRGQQKTLERISVERDETLELLERAIKQKESIKKTKRMEAEAAQAEIDYMRKLQAQEQNEVRRLLAHVDELLAKVGHGGNLQDSLRKLVSIRDGMRELVKAREKPFGFKDGDGEAG